MSVFSSIYIEGIPSEEHEVHSFELLSTVISVPSLQTRHLLSVVGVVDGQVTVQVSWFYHERKKDIHLQSFLPLQSGLVPTLDWHRPGFSPSERTGTGFSAFKHHSTSQLERTPPLMSSSPRSWSRDSPTRKVGSAFFRTHIYCDTSPCLADLALSVVGFCGRSEYCKVAG